jgi:hypothetical protein
MLFLDKGLDNFGLDKRFLGGKWQKKNNGGYNGNRMSRFAMRSVERDGSGVADHTEWLLYQSWNARLSLPILGPSSAELKEPAASYPWPGTGDIKWNRRSGMCVKPIQAPEKNARRCSNEGEA